MRVRVPYDSGGKRLHLHDVPKEVNALRWSKEENAMTMLINTLAAGAAGAVLATSPLAQSAEIIREILPTLIVRPLHPSALRPKNSTCLFVATY